MDRADKLRQLLQKHHAPRAETPVVQSSVQDIYTRKLEGDIERTKRFLAQANDAIERLQQQLGPLPEHYDAPEAPRWDPPGDWDADTQKMAHVLALHEVYKQLPYSPMKNDSIGIATALVHTQTAVRESAESAAALAEKNAAQRTRVQNMKTILGQYKLAEELVQRRIREQPAKVAELERKLQNAGSVAEELAKKHRQVQDVAASAQAVEQRMYQHLEKVVVKLCALHDWEQAQMMDEAMFERSIGSTVNLLWAMVTKLVTTATPAERWVRVEDDAGKRFVEVLARHDLVLVRDDGAEVQLREYGLDFQ